MRGNADLPVGVEHGAAQRRRPPGEGPKEQPRAVLGESAPCDSRGRTEAPQRHGLVDLKSNGRLLRSRKDKPHLAEAREDGQDGDETTTS